MIVKWKRITAVEFTAQWSGRQVTLVWEEYSWRVWVEGVRTRQKFNSAALAMETVEYIVNQQVIAASVSTTAQQRASSAERIRSYANA